MVKYRWVQRLNVEELQKLISTKIKTLTIGNLVESYTEEIDPLTQEKMTVPIFVEGFEVEFETQPTPKELAALTKFFQFEKWKMEKVE